MIWWALVVLWGTTARGQEYTAPVIVDLVTATYPAEALEQRREAVVEVWVELDAAGAVLNVTVPEPAGYGFDEAAMAAARSSTFAPGQQGKDAVAMTFVVSFVFELPSASGSQIVTGVVHHRGTVRTLEGVMIELITEGVRFRTETAGDGSFRFEGLPAGPAEVRVTHPGFQPEQARLVLVEGQSSTLTFRLLRTSRGETVAMGTYAAEDVAIEHRLSGEVVRVVPGAFGDPVRVVETLPAVAVSPIVDGQPVVRGAEGTHTRVTVDGIDVPFVFHWFLGRSIVNPSLLEEVRFVPGGLPAAIGQSSQALLDARMATRQDGEGLHGRVSVDIMDSSLALWGSRNQWDLSVGGRVAWLGALTTLVTSPSPSSIQPNYFDYSFGASNTIGHHKIRFDLFGAGDSLSWSAWALSNTPDESLPYNEALIFSRAFHRGAATWNTYGNWGEQRTFFAAGYEGEHNPSGVFLLSPLQEGVRRGRLQGAALQFGNETSLIVGERAEIAVGLHGDYRNFLDRRYINLVQIEDGRFSVGWLSP
ncbi:MAG: TonB family protein, partial [Myxococcota bacterium]